MCEIVSLVRLFVDILRRGQAGKHERGKNFSNLMTDFVLWYMIDLSSQHIPLLFCRLY